MRTLILTSVFLLNASLAVADVPPSPRQEPPAKPATFELDGNALKLPGLVVFETGSDKLKPESDVALAHVVAYLNAKDYISLMRVENHSDNAGDPKVAQSLSERRALAVTRWLVSHGIACKRLIPVGFGGNKPIASNATPDGRAANRRSTFVNAELRGRAIGGMPADGGGMVAGDPCK